MERVRDTEAEAVPRQEPPQPSQPALAAKADDLEAIRNAVLDAAGVAAGIWLSYLFVLFYLLIAAGGVTHRDLLFENPVRLPFLNVDLPLKVFFWLGPALFLVVHVYVLVQFVLLAGKVGVFDRALRAQIDDPKVRARLRRQLPSNIFVQLLAGPREVREGLMGFLLQLIAWITVVIGPVALLMFFQLQFLPYHDASITWWQRIAVLIDLGLLWTLWPSVARGEAIGDAWRGIKSSVIALMTIASLAPVLFVFLIATFPGERLELELAHVRLIKSVHDFFVAGDIDLVARKQKSIWSNRIVLPQLDVIDHAKFDTESKVAAIRESASLRTRDLRGAVLIGATLRSVDFTGADLRDARLEYADMRGAKLACEPVSLRNDNESVLNESCVKLQNAVLDRANLQGTNLLGAQLQGASFDAGQLQGASFVRAQMLGASLWGASLQGATLYAASLVGANFFGADLQAADLDYADLRAANLETANFRAATLQGTQLQGADLDRANLNFSILAGAFVWRADARPTHVKEASITAEGACFENLETAMKFVCHDPKKFMSDVCDWSNTAYDNLNRTVEEQIPSNSRRQEATRRIERLNPSSLLEGEAEMALRWVALTRSSPSISTYEQSLIQELTEIGCTADGAPYVLDGIILHVSSITSPFESRDARSKLAVAFLDKGHCPGARGLSDSADATLKGFLTTPRRTERGRAPHP